VPSAEATHHPPERRTELLAVGALVWTAALFGTSFVVVKDGLDDMRPVPYLAMRYLVAALVFAALARRRPGRPGESALALKAGITYAVILLPFVPFTGGLRSGGGSWLVIGYTAIFVTVGTFLPWMWAQRHIPPTRAALVLLTEPVFAAIASYATGERLSATALAGAALILAGAALAELSELWSPGAAVRRRPNRLRR